MSSWTADERPPLLPQYAREFLAKRGAELTGALFLLIGGALAAALAAFHADLGEAFSRTTVLVMTEFGRRVAENGSTGTDHGRGSVFLTMGEGVGHGRVRGRWPGLAPEHRAGPGDLAVTTDVRQAIVDALAPRWPGVAACFGLA